MAVKCASSESLSWSSISNNLFRSTESDEDAGVRQGSDPAVSSERTRATGLGINRFCENLFYVSYNEMSLKILGSKRKVSEELERQKDCNKLVIHPCSKFR